MRKQTKLLLAAVYGTLALLLLGVLPLYQSRVLADETKAGATRAEAKVIGLGETYSETTVDKNDTDFFRFTTTEHGYFQVQLGQNAADSQKVRAGWDMKVLDEDGKELTAESGIKEKWTSIVLPYAEPGRVFYVQVTPVSWGVPKDCTYDITVSQTATEEWEAEPNETQAAATVIEPDKTYHGITVGDKDTDMFRFTTTKQGYFQVQLGRNAADGNDIRAGWEVKVLDENGVDLTTVTGVKENWTSVILPYAEPGRTFYLQVAPVSWGIPKHCVYDVTISQTEATDWEAEPNGTKETATTIRAGQTYQGITMAREDEDYYKLAVSAAGKLKVELRPSDTNLSDSIHAGWDIFVYDKDLKEVTKRNGVKTADSVSFNVKKGTYYILVKGVSWSSPVKCRYELSTTYAKKPAKTTISSVKASGKTATIAWNKVPDATGYVIYRSTSKNSGYKKVKTITKNATTAWKNTGLKSGKTYYYKVAAYKKTGGVTSASGYSAVKSVTVK